MYWLNMRGGGTAELFIKIILHILMLQSYVPKLGVSYAFNGPAWFLSACLLIWFLTPYLQYFLSKIEHKRTFIILECMTFFIQFGFLIGIYVLRLEDQRYFMYVFPPVNLIIYFEAMVFGYIAKNSMPWKETKIKCLYIGALIALCVMYLVKNIIPVDFRIYFWQMPVIVLVYILATWEEKKYIRIYENRALVFVGNISTEVFLFHYSVIHLMDILGVMDIPCLGVISAFGITAFLGYCVKKRGKNKYEKNMYGSS